MIKIALVASMALSGANAFDLGGAISKGTAILEGSKSEGGSSSSLSALSSSEVSSGLKQALNQGIDASIKQLGATNGFYGDELVKILLPDSMQSVADVVRKAGGGKYVDNFILSMNRAAEKSVTKVAPIFGDALSSMSIDDAKNILSGGENAATEYFEQKAGGKIVQTVEPIIKSSMSDNGVYKYYNMLKGYYDDLGGDELLGSVSNSGLGAIASSVAGVSVGDGKFMSQDELDKYMSTKTSDGLFTIIAEQEKEIRNSLGARSTPLLKKVCGALN
ncbi:MAG: DUF4197 domain-containing protein [Campylobacterales bacterium]